jgi:pimeloyl-ACP methyl ester carboxylesterase
VRPLIGQAAPTVDRSPHKERFIDVGAGVRLQVLDWGGKGRTVVLVPGYGLNAHIYDDFAPRLAGKFRVIAVTLRGWAPSDAPPTGYTNQTAAHDIVAILDTLRVDQADLIGHSFGGDIITKVATEYPGRVRALVYLDAAFAIPGRDSVWALQPLQRPPPAPPAKPIVTLADYVAWYRAYAGEYIYGLWTPALENELVSRLSGQTPAQMAKRDSLTSLYGREAPADSLRIDYSAVSQPALAICAIATPKTLYPWLTADSTRWAAATTFADSVLAPFLRRECTAFRDQARAGTTTMLDSTHYVFIYRLEDSVQSTVAFLSSQR